MWVLVLFAVIAATRGQDHPTVVIATTQSAYQGDFGGIGAADGECNVNALEDYYAFLWNSDGMNPILSDRTEYFQIVDVFGNTLIPNVTYAELYEALFPNLQHFSLPDTSGVTRNYTDAWTGQNGDTCSDWTSANESFTGDTVNVRYASGILLLDAVECNQAFPLICVTLPKPSYVTPHQPIGKAFVMYPNMLFTGNFGSAADADRFCSESFGSEGWSSLLVTQGQVAENIRGDTTSIQLVNMHNEIILNNTFYQDAPYNLVYGLNRNQTVVTNQTGIPFNNFAAGFPILFGSDDYDCNSWTREDKRFQVTAINAFLGSVFLSDLPCGSYSLFACISPVVNFDVSIPTPIAPVKRVILGVTPSLTDGNLDGFAGGDAICNAPEPDVTYGAYLFNDTNDLNPTLDSTPEMVYVTNSRNETMFPLSVSNRIEAGSILATTMGMNVNFTYVTGETYLAFFGAWLGGSPTFYALFFGGEERKRDEIDTDNFASYAGSYINELIDCGEWTSDSESGLAWITNSFISGIEICSTEYHLLCRSQVIEVSEMKTFPPFERPALPVGAMVFLWVLFAFIIIFVAIILLVTTLTI